MPFPAVQSITETSFATPSTTHNVSMPATVDAGDLLLVVIALTEDNAGAPPLVDTPTDWTEMLQTRSDNSPNDQTLAVFAKVADGSEDGGAVDFETSLTGDCVAAAQCYRVTAWSGTLAGVEVGTSSTGGSDTVAHPSLTASWGAEDNLWFAIGGLMDDDATINAYPTNYGNGVDTISGAGTNAGGTVFSARRELNAATEDPGDSTVSEAEAWIGNTLVVRPAAGGPTPGGQRVRGMQSLDAGFAGLHPIESGL